MLMIHLYQVLSINNALAKISFCNHAKPLFVVSNVISYFNSDALTSLFPAVILPHIYGYLDHLEINQQYPFLVRFEKKNHNNFSTVHH